MGLYQAIVDNPVRYAIGMFLQTEVYKSSWIMLDMWSIVHIISGMGLMWILILKGKKSKYLWLLGLVFLYEVVEVFVAMSLVEIFIQERVVNIVWDIVVAMLGGACIDYLYRKT